MAPDSMGTEPPSETGPEPNKKESILPKATRKAADALTWVLRSLRYAYLLRVPIVIGSILFCFPITALRSSSGLRPLLQNIFLLDGGAMWPWPTFWSTMAALVVAWSALLTARIILLNCGDRFNIPSLMTAANLRGWHVFAVLGLALPAICGQFTQQGDFRPTQGMCSQCVWAVVAAALSSYLLAFSALWFAVLLAPPRTQGSALTFPCFGFMRRWLEWADNHHILPKGLRLGIWIRDNLPCSLWRGYLASDGFVWSGHWLALLFGIATLGLYFSIDWWHGRSLGQPSRVTALTFVLLLLLNVNWILSFLTFFLDRFRIPVLVPFALFAYISGSSRDSDHYFQLNPLATSMNAASPADVLRARAGKPIVVIATAGGGIQAATWTAEVLAGLQEEYAHWYPGESFADNVTLISSVSGGATGSMFYLNLYDANLAQHFHADQLPALTDLVSQSSLDDVAWALVYHDLPRIFFFDRDKAYDRGYILEETWSRRAQLNETLTEWRNGVKEGWRPAVIFNSTVAETGEPLAFSTTDWKQEKDPQTDKEILPRRRDFYHMYFGRDLRVVTAVRLAASFPYVTPAARPETDQRDDYHMIDGGYYDNYGIANLIAWLEEGLTDLQPKCQQGSGGAKGTPSCPQTAPPRILVLQIRSFPPDEEAKATKKGWAFQLYAPIEGLLSVRTTAQLVRDREALTMFAHRWECEGTLTPQATIQFATFEYGGCKIAEEGDSAKYAKARATKNKAANPPLSWAMNPSQIQAIKDDWNARVNRADPCGEDPNIDKVRCFFDPSLGPCNKLSQRPE